jgi:hypothetical protein
MPSGWRGNNVLSSGVERTGGAHGQSTVQIIDIAVPPKSPVSPNSLLGAELLALGLVSSVAGWRLLKS